MVILAYISHWKNRVTASNALTVARSTRLTMHELHVAVGIVLDAQQRILISKRQAHQEFAHLWEFPGGKREAHETVREALVRELYEEVGLIITSAQPWLQIPQQETQRPVLLDVWRVLAYEGEPQGMEGQELAWMAISQSHAYRFPDANQQILQALAHELAGSV